MSTTKPASLGDILPPFLFTERLTLQLFDFSQQHYDWILDLQNTPTAHALMGDIGIRTRPRLEEFLAAIRLSPEAVGGLRVDRECFYFLREGNSRRALEDAGVPVGAPNPAGKHADASAATTTTAPSASTTTTPSAATSSKSSEDTKAAAEALLGPMLGGISLAQRGSAPPDLGWCMAEASMRRGYAPEGAREVLRMARETLGMRRLMAWPGPENRPSQRVAQKIGLVRGPDVRTPEGETAMIYVLPGMEVDGGMILSRWGDEEAGPKEGGGSDVKGATVGVEEKKKEAGSLKA